MRRTTKARARAIALVASMAATTPVGAQAPAQAEASVEVQSQETRTTPVRCVETVVERGVESRRDAWAGSLAWTPPVLVAGPGRAWTFAAEGVGAAGSLALENLDARTIRHTLAVPNGSIRTVVRDEVPLELTASAMDVGTLRTLECR